MITTDKNELRAEMKRLLKESPEGMSLRDDIALPDAARNAKTLFTFMPFGHEIDPGPLVKELHKKGTVVAIPRVTGQNLSFHRLDSSEGPFISGAFGIREPDPSCQQVFPPLSGTASIEFPLLILIPGLAFTRFGGRLGRGAGFYDRFLARILSAFPEKRNAIILAGTCRSFQIINLLPAEIHDVPVDCLLTESGCILCRESSEGEIDG